MMCYFPCGSDFPGNKKRILSGWMRPHGPLYYVIMQCKYIICKSFPNYIKKVRKLWWCFHNYVYEAAMHIFD